MTTILPSFALLLLVATGWCQTNAAPKHVEDIIYGRKFGTALTLDVIQPDKANGVGIIHIVS